jgi:peptidoglycan hydrolase-like protein with peptidoglycan-binding domain
MGSQRSWGDMSLFRPGHAAAQVSPGSADAGRSRGKAVLSGILGLTAAMVMAGGIVTVVRAHHGEHGAGSVAAISEASGPVSTSSRHRGTRTATPIQAPTIVSSTPGPDARDVNGAEPVQLTLSGVPTARSPLPRVSPPAPGSWSRRGTGLTFTPSAGFPEDTWVTITMPGHREAGRDGGGVAGSAVSFSTGSYATLRLQQLLAQLGYLPLSWSPRLGGSVMPGNAQAQLLAAYRPPAGRFTWVSGYPSHLASLWRPGRPNLIDTGAIMAFESGHGLPLDGVASATVWSDLLRAAEAQQDNPHGYTYALASKVIPETLTIWHDGQQVFSSPANTGIPIDPTSDGTFPVYLRYRFQVMQGTNPDGTHYADPVQFVAYFQAGQAVHYFPRYSYGWPQSLGCVELPLAAAAQAWPYLTYGSLVTVTPY